MTASTTFRLTLAVLLLPLGPLWLAAAPPGGAAAGAGILGDASPFAGYELVEASYLLRAPDGSLVRVTRLPAGAAVGPGEWRGEGRLTAEPLVTPVFGLQGWLNRFLYRSPRAVSELGEYVRASWTVIQRLLDYLGVVVLFAGTWVIYYLVRPALLGVPDRVAFLLIFAAVAGLWYYATHLYLSVLYALGLMLLPALCIGVAAWVLRRLWAAIVGRRAQPAAP